MMSSRRFANHSGRIARCAAVRDASLLVMAVPPRRSTLQPIPTVSPLRRHCERSEAIQAAARLDCSAALAMTGSDSRSALARRADVDLLGEGGFEEAVDVAVEHRTGVA